MNRREWLENPTGQPQLAVMQQPDLGRLGRLTGPPLVTMGDATDSTSDAMLTTSGLFGIPWTSILMIGGALIGGALLLKHVRGGGAGSPAPRRRRSFKLPKVSLPTVAMLCALAGALAYFYAKSQSSSLGSACT